jgi:phosphoribosylformimino-5-aminoimidazole carboxamide ribotide isomerase
VILYPAIDIKEGAAVRLVQGDLDQETRYDDHPEEAARRWAGEGASWLHVVDLDGAVAGEPRNLKAIEKILRAVSLPVQVGGGVRTLAALERLLDLGVRRVVLGTAALEKPEVLEEAAARFPGRVALGLDARGGRVAVRGWRETRAETAHDVARQFDALALAALIYTDIEVDGTLRGPNVAATEALARAVRTPVIASGGIAGLADLRRVKGIEAAGVEGVIVGRALYTGNVRLGEALAVIEGPQASPPSGKAGAAPGRG